MGFNLKDIESKLNSFTDKMNEIGDQVSDALNKGTVSFDDALNSCVNSIDNKMDSYVQKKEQEKAEKQVEKEKVEPTVQSEIVSEPIPQPIEGTGVVEGVSFANVSKPSIDLSKENDSGTSVINQSSLDKGVNLSKE